MRKKWKHGLVYSDYELERYGEGYGGEAFSFVYHRGQPTKAQSRGARKELRQRYKRRQREEEGIL